MIIDSKERDMMNRLDDHDEYNCESSSSSTDLEDDIICCWTLLNDDPPHPRLGTRRNDGSPEEETTWWTTNNSPEESPLPPEEEPPQDDDDNDHLADSLGSLVIDMGDDEEPLEIDLSALQQEASRNGNSPEQEKRIDDSYHSIRERLTLNCISEHEVSVDPILLISQHTVSSADESTWMEEDSFASDLEDDDDDDDSTSSGPDPVARSNQAFQTARIFGKGRRSRQREQQRSIGGRVPVLVLARNDSLRHMNMNRARREVKTCNRTNPTRYRTQPNELMLQLRKTDSMKHMGGQGRRIVRSAPEKSPDGIPIARSA